VEQTGKRTRKQTGLYRPGCGFLKHSLLLYTNTRHSKGQIQVSNVVTKRFQTFARASSISSALKPGVQCIASDIPS